VIPLIKRKAVRDIKEGRELASEAVASDPMAAHKTVDAEAGNQQQAPIHANNATVHQAPNFSADAEKEEGKHGLALYLGKAKTQLAKGTNYDIHAVVETDPIVAALHARAEKFDPRIEVVFSYLQVFSAIAVIFAHGAGEVGYMSGPLGQIYNIVKTGKVSDKSFEPVMWVLVLSAFSLVFGLATYGYNVMQAMGTMMCKLSPSRGFAAELATSMVIMIAAQYGLPTSSSQCITGGILGTQLCSINTAVVHCTIIIV
jgi:solute carrier family 20 (sodium-dependent phosphate transporter)